MKLKLLYKGELPSRRKDPTTGHYDRLAGPIHAIRKQLHPQLKAFWQTNIFLKNARKPSDTSLLSPAEASGRWDDGPKQNAQSLKMHVANNFQENGYKFTPLVLQEWNLSCALDILILRRDTPESPLQDGDLDNRVKSLVDGLRKPNGANELRKNPTPDNGEDPFFVLLQDDSLVTDLRVETDNLLVPSTYGKENHVVALISVEIRPYDISTFNLGFY